MAGDMTLSVLIITGNASVRFGGEAILPLQYFRFLRERGVDVRLVAHERTRKELQETLGEDFQRVALVSDHALNKALVSWSAWLPDRFADFTLHTFSHWFDELRLRRLARDMVRTHSVDVIHVPTPVSPRLPSFLWKMGAPVIFGPMNGAMDFPPGYNRLEPAIARAGVMVLRSLSTVMNWVIPGKRKAALLLAANRRTINALPSPLRAVETFPENGVDLALFSEATEAPERSEPLKVAFVGRLVDWKRVDLLLRACIAAKERAPLTLDVVGDGPCLAALREQALPLGQQVTFHGLRDHGDVARILRGCDVLVLPSMRECGGAVVLEAMATGKPVIATNWGGPADYLDASCGILIDPQTPQAFVADLSAALQALAADPERRRRLGRAGRARVEKYFDWRAKVGRMLAIYRTVAMGEQVPRAAKLGRTTPA
jgi:glycosyltransferase involved in cell wall biosynthesis